MFAPFGMLAEIFSRILLLYAQTCYRQTSYMFHIPSKEINAFVTKHIARKTISLKVRGS